MHQFRSSEVTHQFHKSRSSGDAPDAEAKANDAICKLRMLPDMVVEHKERRNAVALWRHTYTFTWPVLPVLPVLP